MPYPNDAALAGLLAQVEQYKHQYPNVSGDLSHQTYETAQREGYGGSLEDFLTEQLLRYQDIAAGGEGTFQMPNPIPRIRKSL